jgi:hypothetical protein
MSASGAIFFGRRDRHDGRGSPNAVPNPNNTDPNPKPGEPAPLVGADEAHAPQER